MKTSLFIFLTLFSFILVPLHQCGHIYSQPTEIIPQNAGSAGTFNFFFMLETQLATSDCIFIKFPMIVGSGSTSAAITTSLNPAVIPVTPITVSPYPLDDVATSLTVDDRFFLLSSGLSANTWYRMQINITTAANQNVGVQGCVWFATTSDYSDNYITYDENRCFDVLSFAPTIDISGNAFKVTGYYLYAATSSYKNFGGSYGVNFDITPSQNVSLPGAIFTLALPTHFTFTGTCSSISCSSNDGSAGDYCISTNLTALPSTGYTCATASNLLTLTVTQAVNLATFRITATIQNDYCYVGSAGTIVANFQSAKAPIIFATSNVVVGSYNGINLVIGPAQFSTLTGVVRLMWGVVPSISTVYSAASTTRASGFAGCPIVLYASSTNNPVYNSLQTTFTLANGIKAMKSNQNILAVWTLATSGGLTLVTNVIQNSFFSTMPGTLRFSYASNNALLTISGITDLSASSYIIGGKFDVVASGNSAAFSTVSGSTAASCGGVTIKTGDNAYTYGSVTGTTIGVKANMDYYDTATFNTGQGTLKLYNQIYSYWSSDSKLTDFTSTTLATVNGAFKNYFLGKTSGDGATAAVWPRPSSLSSTNIQALFINLYFVAGSVCPTSTGTSNTNYLSTTLTKTCADTSKYTGLIGVLLKVVFNNGMLGITSANYGSAAQNIGGLFPSPGTLGTYSLSASVNIGNVIVADSTNNFAHLSLSCAPGAPTGTTPDTSCFVSSSYGAAGATAVSGVSILNTNILKYTTMYADQYVLDFIVCFKIGLIASLTTPVAEASSSWQLVEEGATSSSTYTPTAGPGLINGYVISGMVDSSSIQTNLVMGYSGSSTSGYSEGTGLVANYIPAYLRLGAKITSPVAGASTLGFFIGGQADSNGDTFAEGLSQYSDPITGSINIIDTVSTATTAIFNYGATSYYQQTTDLWWAQNSLLITASASSGTAFTFNYYVPIQTSFSTIDSLNVVFLGSMSNGQYAVNAVYRIFGGVVSNTILSGGGEGTAGYSLAFTVASLTNPAFTTVLPSSGSYPNVVLAFTATDCAWDAGATAANPVTTVAGGCFQGATTGSGAPHMSAGSGSFLPSNTLSGFTIISDVTNYNGASNICGISGGNTAATLTSTTYNTPAAWGTAFIVYVRENTNIFSSSTLTWSYTSNKCYPHTVVIKYPSGSPVVYQIVNIYTIFCTADQPTGLSLTFGNGGSIAFNTFTVPFFWGTGYSIQNKVNYGWSAPSGLWASFNGDPATTSAWTLGPTGCTASDNLALAANSYDVPFTLTLSSSNGVIYKLAPNDELILTISAIPSSTSLYSVCTHATLSCSINGLAITLTNSLPANPVALSIAGSSISVQGWIDTGATAGSSTTYNVLTTYYNYATTTSYTGTIETCASSASGGFQVTGNALTNVVAISSWNYMANQGARGIWSFSFNYPRIIRAGYDFILNVGPFAGPTSSSPTSNNYRCLILQNGVVSNSWLSISPISSSAYTTTVTADDQFSSGGTFTFQCIGGSTPDGTVAFTNTMTGYVERTPGNKITATTPPTANTYTLTAPTAAAPSLSGVTLTKFFNTRGFDSDYVINFLPIAANITTSGRIVVEFSQSIPPKFNKDGKVGCYLNETPAICDYPSERRIHIWPTMSLLTTAGYPYVLRIAGVTQPNSLGTSPSDADSNKQIYFALCATNNPYNGVTESVYLTETWDSASATATIASILIHDFTISTNVFRSATTFTYVLNIPANTFTTAGSILWVQFPGSLDGSLFYGTSPSFSFVRVYDSTNTNIVQSYSMLRARRVAVFMKADSVNSNAVNYTLTISNVMTPQYPSPMGFMRDDFRIFTSADNITVAASTASGSRNTSTYISWTPGTYTATQVLNWYSPTGTQIMGRAPVSIGTYQSLFYLSASMNNFVNTFSFAVNGGNSSVLLTQPMNPNYPIRAVLGTSQAPIYIGAKSGTAQGAYFLQFSSTDTTDYASIPNLDLQVVSVNCTPALPSNTFSVPYGGGTSDPIVIDFSQCIPISDVTITANVSQGFSLSSASGISLSGSQTQQASLTFSNMQANYKVAFYAVSNSGSNGTTTSGAATISFAMSGTNGANINSPGTVTINLVQGSTVAPVPSTPTISTDSAGTHLGVGCSITGTNFFVIGTYYSAANYNITYITSVTQAVKVALTAPAPNDPYYTVFGYVAGLPTPPALASVLLNGYLKAGANLTVYSMCYSNSLVPSTNSSLWNWVQIDNGGATVVLKASFKAPLTPTQKVEMACAIAKALVIPSAQVQTDQGTHCTSLRVLQTSNTTNTTNTTTTNTSTSNTSTTTYPALFYVLKNYLAATDTTSTTVTNAIASSTFLSGLITSINDASFPVPASTSFAATVLNSSSAAASTTIPVVNLGSTATDNYDVNATFNLTNMNGLVFAGIEPYLVNVSSTPNASNLVLGLNGNSAPLSAFGYAIATTGANVAINLTGLTNHTAYVLYYAGNNLDISINGIFSAVQAQNVSTTNPSGSFGSVIRISIMVMGLVLLALFGMI